MIFMQKLSIYFVLLALPICVNAATITPKATIKFQAKIEKGCQLSNKEQSLNFNQHAALSQHKVEANIQNNAQSWNIRCTEKMPISIQLNAGDHASNQNWRMKHSVSEQYIPYLLYQDSAKSKPYETGQAVALIPATQQSEAIEFSIFAVADLNNNNQPRAAGIYQDRVAITITW